VARHAKILSQLGAHQDAVMFRTNSAREEVERQLQALARQLIRRREAEADRLLDAICIDHKGRGLGFTSYFKSVREAWIWRDCSDPTEARELLVRLKALWSVQPLAPLLWVCEQEVSGIRTAEVATT
jgi:hypothetical protein